jgi:hypothetical protein
MKKATYSLGSVTVQSAANSLKKFEVPSKGWFDSTFSKGSYDVSILEEHDDQNIRYDSCRHCK